MFMKQSDIYDILPLSKREVAIDNLRGIEDSEDTEEYVTLAEEIYNKFLDDWEKYRPILERNQTLKEPFHILLLHTVSGTYIFKGFGSNVEAESNPSQKSDTIYIKFDAETNAHISIGYLTCKEILMKCITGFNWRAMEIASLKIASFLLDKKQLIIMKY